MPMGALVCKHIIGICVKLHTYVATPNPVNDRNSVDHQTRQPPMTFRSQLTIVNKPIAFFLPEIKLRLTKPRTVSALFHLNPLSAGNFKRKPMTRFPVKLLTRNILKKAHLSLTRCSDNGLRSFLGFPSAQSGQPGTRNRNMST